MLADYYGSGLTQKLFRFDQIDRKELQQLLCEWSEFDVSTVQLITLFAVEKKKNVSHMNERTDLEQDIPVEPEKITSDYQLFDWHNIPGDGFPARQKDCSCLRKGGGTGKGPSGETLYQIINMCHWFGEEAERDPRKYLDLPEDPDFPEKCKLPEYLVVNLCVPNYQPAIFRNITAGPSTTLLAVAKITDECRRRYENGEPNEADRLLERFLYRPEPPKGDYNVRRRLKCIVKMANYGCDAVRFGHVMNQVVSRYNGTPFLLRDSTSFYEESDKSMVVTADANLFGRLAKNSLWKCRTYSVNAVMDCCCIIEADADDNDELPENTFLSWRMKCPIFPDL